MRKLNIKRWIEVGSWQQVLLGVVGVLAAFGLFFFRLRALVPGFSAPEAAAIKASSSLDTILANPLNLPHKLLQLALQTFGKDGIIAMRGVTALFGLLFGLLFYYVIRRWYSHRVAAITSILFVCSSWFLHIARLATPDIMMLSIMLPLGLGAWLPNQKAPIRAIVGITAVGVWLLYIPGLVWLVLLGVFWQRKKLIKTIFAVKPILPFMFAGLIILLLPLVIAIIRDTNVLWNWLGLPSSSLNFITEIPQKLIRIPSQLIWRGPKDPVIWLGRLPLLDFFIVTMCLLGAYNYSLDYKLDRARVLFGGIIFCCLLVTIGGFVSMIILLPLLYLLAAGGLAYVIAMWYKVFPNNPIAHGLASILIFSAMISSCYYNLSHYFVAWPQTPATRQAFKITP